MSIIQSKITENSIQSDGTHYVSYEYVFQNGDTISFNSIQRPNNYDVNAGLIEHAIKAKKQIIEREDSELMAQIENGISPLDILPIHPDTETAGNRKRRFRRKLLRWIVNQDDLKLIRKVFYPVWYWLKFESGYTTQQIASYLDVSITVLQRINCRFQALHDKLTFIDADEQYIGEVE